MRVCKCIVLSFVLLAWLAPSPARAQDTGRGEIRLQFGGPTYVWNGRTLRKRWSSSNEFWLFDGRNLRPQFAEESAGAYRWTGRELRPVHTSGSRQTYVWDGKDFKPKFGARHENTWRLDGRKWKRKMGGRHENTWVVTGEVPVAVVGLVLFGVVS